jgi:hypothetical protein
VTEVDLTQIEQLMLLARKHGATAIRFRGVSIVMGEAPRVSGMTHARPGVQADAGLPTMPAPPESMTPLGHAIQAAMVAPDDDEPTAEELAEVEEFNAWKYGRTG